MKFSTNNIKSSDYTDQHVIYVGTQTGSFKSKSKTRFVFIFTRISRGFCLYSSGVDLFNDDSPYKQTNIQSLDALTRDSKITAMSWADENVNEVLIGRADSVIRTYDCSKNQFYETDLTIGEGAVTGLAWSNE